MPPNLSYRLKRVCGSVFTNGNIIFTPDGNSILSPVGNRVTIIDLLQQNCITLPFESRKNIKRLCISNNGLFLIIVDVDGHALFVNLPRRVILCRFRFKRKVYAIKFAPDDQTFAVTFGHGCQIWRTPGIKKEFSPLILSRTIGGHHDDTLCLDWSTSSESLIIGSKDLTAKVFYRVKSKNMAMTTLTGHRDVVVGAFFSKDEDMAYTIARDGAVFTWIYEHGERITIGGDGNDNNSDYDDEAEDLDLDQDDQEKEAEIIVRTRRGGAWKLKEREFLWDPHTQVKSADFNRATGILVIGFNTGVFGIYEMPGCVNIHRLSVSNQSLNSATINTTGEWIAVGSSRLGQLLVWEWQSETYVIKQQGHLYGLSSLDMSADGQYIATGGEDSKVKLWNATSGFCFVTFSEHVAPVTGVKFAGKGNGKAILSCSLDGTVRAHDLLRYKNFKTLTTPKPVQFTCLAVDPSGEVVCSGSLDPFEIYVWSLQTGHLLDVLAGHEGPIQCLDFANGTSTLCSGSWDGTAKLWDVYKSTNVETFEHGCDVLAVAFRPDGQELCTATTNGMLNIWDVENGTLIVSIEGKADISGGRLTTDARTSKNSTLSKHFTSVVYSADGNYLLAGGHSKYVCIYAIATRVLVKKFQLSHNRSLEGVLDELRSDRLVDGINLDNLNDYDSDDENIATSVTPGASGGKGKANDGSRTTRPDILTTAVKFSSTGREWAAATSQGLQVYSLDEDLLFAPTDLDITITPQAVDVALSREEYSLALNMALQLGEQIILKKVFSKIPMSAINLVIKSVDVRMLRDIIRFIANELASSVHLEFYLQWTHEILQNYGKILNSDSMPYRESLRALLRAISIHEKEIMRYAEDNHFTLNFITSQLSGDDINDVDDDDDDNDIETNNKYNYNEDNNNINNDDDDNDMKILKKSNHKRKQPTIEVNNVNNDDDNTKPVKASKGKGKSKAKKTK